MSARRAYATTRILVNIAIPLPSRDLAAGFRRWRIVTSGDRSAPLVAMLQSPDDNRDIKMTTVYTCRAEKSIGAERVKFER
jgi:hypothetical protein